MSNTDFEVLTELYRFLAQFKPDVIAAAARRRAPSENIRIALDALAREARANGKALARLHHTAARRGTRANAEGLSSAHDLKEYRSHLEAFLLDPRRFPDKLTMANFARAVGLPDAANPKYSRERVASRIVQYAIKDPSVRDRLSELVSSYDSGLAQTKGWMDLTLRDR